MYIEYFKLTYPPFQDTPNPHFFFETEERTEALASMWYTIMQRRGLMLLTGDAGVGKSMLVRMLIDRLHKQAVFVEPGAHQCSDTDVAHAICAELNFSPPGDATPAQLQRFVLDGLAETARGSRPVALIVDGANALSESAFRFIAQLSDLDASTTKLIQILFVGDASLRHRLHASAYQTIRQRLSRVCHLSPFTAEETAGYIRHRLSLCGCESGELFTDAALERVHATTNGVPRVINTICDNAMLVAMSDESEYVDAQHVDEAATMIDCEPLDLPAYSGDDVYEGSSGTRGMHGDSPMELNLLSDQIDQLRAITDMVRHSGFSMRRPGNAANMPPRSRLHNQTDPTRNTDELLQRLSRIEQQVRDSAKESPRQATNLQNRLDAIEKGLHGMADRDETWKHQLRDELKVDPPSPHETDPPTQPPATTAEVEVHVVEYEPFEHQPDTQDAATGAPASEPVDEELEMMSKSVAERLRHRRERRAERAKPGTDHQPAEDLLQNVQDLDSLISEMCRRDPS